MNDVVENSLQGLSHSLWMRTRLWLRLIDHDSRDIFVIFSYLRKFPFFNASVAELVDEVIDCGVKRMRMIFFLLLRKLIFSSFVYVINTGNQILDFVRICEYESA